MSYLRLPNKKRIKKKSFLKFWHDFIRECWIDPHNLFILCFSVWLIWYICNFSVSGIMSWPWSNSLIQFEKVEWHLVWIPWSWKAGIFIWNSVAGKIQEMFFRHHFFLFKIYIWISWKICGLKKWGDGIKLLYLVTNDRWP